MALFTSLSSCLLACVCVCVYLGSALFFESSSRPKIQLEVVHWSIVINMIVICHMRGPHRASCDKLTIVGILTTSLQQFHPALSIRLLLEAQFTLSTCFSMRLPIILFSLSLLVHYYSLVMVPREKGEWMESRNVLSPDPGPFLDRYIFRRVTPV